jgi:hypothetical protein
MKNRIRKSVAAAGLGATLLFASAVPAQAAGDPAHCPHGLTPKEVIDCACIIAATIVDSVLPGQTQWDCDSNPPI